MTMTDEPVSTLADDLELKFKELGAIYDHPAFYVSEHFYELRNRIDIDAEQILLDSAQKAQHVNVNELRSAFIGILKSIEKDILNHLPVPPNSTGFGQVYAALGQKIDEFRKSLGNDSDIRGLEDAYVSLAQEIFDKSSQLQARLFGNQTIVYLNAAGQLGQLFYVERGHLNEAEVEALSTLPHQQSQLIEIHLAIERARNNAMKIHLLKPFLITRSILIISLMKRMDLSSNKRLIYFGSPSESLGGEGLDLNQLLSCQGSLTNEFYGMRIEGFEDIDHVFESFNCPSLKLTSNRLTKLPPQLSALLQHAASININQNQLAHLDEDLIASWTNLRALEMLKSCAPDTKFSLKFLTPLTQLTELEITLPEGPAEFGAFKPLVLLKSLTLEGVSAIDSTKKRTELTLDHFLQLSKLPRLEVLSLSYFEMVSLDQFMLVGFEKLTRLSLIASMISSIHVDAINMCPSRLESLDLRDNQITELQPGLFEKQKHLINLDIKRNRLRTLTSGCFSGLEELQRLYLSHNQIDDLPIGLLDSLVQLKYTNFARNNMTTIKRGIFDTTVNLKSLSLNHNPIKTIEAGSFRHLDSLSELLLHNCQLESINDQMFAGLRHLEYLSLRENQVSSFEIVSEAMRLDKANLSPLELEAVRNNLFKDMPRLNYLYLSSNRLTKLDLNVFCNLVQLKELDLALNRLDELNYFSSERNLASLSKLHLQYNQLTAISKSAFSSATNLDYVDLSNNKLETLDSDFFSPFAKLRNLTLESNDLTFSITRRTFDQARDSLVKIFLADNKLVQIEDGALQATRTLSSLTTDLPTMVSIKYIEPPGDTGSRLSLNDHKSLQFMRIHKSTPDTIRRFLLNEPNFSLLKDTLVWLSLIDSSLVTLDELDLSTRFAGLQKLNLSGNQLRELKSSWIEGLVQLTYLSVSKNCLEQLDDPNLFKRLPELTDLNFSHNKLTHINRHLFRGLFQLSKINLSSNPQLSIIDSTLFRGLMSLKVVNLSGNNIEHLNMDDILRFCPCLEIIDLSNNQLDHGSINSTSMRRGTQLTQLNLAKNRLQSTEFVFHLAHLEKLDLSGNQISSIVCQGFNTLGRLMQLKELNLSGNQLESFDEEMILHLRPTLTHVDLSKNPFDSKEPGILSQINWLPRPYDDPK